MKEKIEAKIDAIVDYIVSKPIEEVTLDDYTVLTNEYKEICHKESNIEHGKRMAELMSMVTAPAYPVYGSSN